MANYIKRSLGYHIRIEEANDFMRSRKIYSASPIRILIKREERKEMEGKMILLDNALKEKLSILHYGFLISRLGKNWYENSKPLESLKFINEKEIGDYVDKKLSSVVERLEILMDITEFRTEQLDYKLNEKIFAYIRKPYALLTKNEVVGLYQNILNKNSKDFPKGFFEFDDGRKSKILTKYLIEDILHLNDGAILSNLKKENFYDYGLGWMLSFCFNDSVVNAVKNAYSEKSVVEDEKFKVGTEKIIDRLVESIMDNWSI